MQHSPKHIVIVGCGFTGTSALFQLVDRYPVEKITIFERSGIFGPGYAYQATESKHYLMNNTNDTLCVLPTNRRAFLAWLKQQPERFTNLDEKGHMPRVIFGEFLQQVFESAKTSAAIKGVHIECIRESVTQITPAEHNGVAHVSVSSNTHQITADAVIVASGRNPNRAMFTSPPTHSKATYISSHICSEQLKQIPLDATVHIMGASLSAFDVVNHLFNEQTGCKFSRDETGELVVDIQNNQRHVVLCSRSGSIKAVQSKQPFRFKREHFTLANLSDVAGERQLTIDDLRQALEQDAQLNNVTINWQTLHTPFAGYDSLEAVNQRSEKLLIEALKKAKTLNNTKNSHAIDAHNNNFLVDFLAQAQDDLWELFAQRKLSPRAERIYRQKIEPAAMAFLAPCPISTAEKLLALYRAKRLSFIKDVTEVRFDKQKDTYCIHHQWGVTLANTLVNTTGTTINTVNDSQQSPLIKYLAQTKQLQPYQCDAHMIQGANIDMQTYRADNQQPIYYANMLLWGPGFFTSSAYMMAKVVEKLLDVMFTASTKNKKAI